MDLYSEIKNYVPKCAQEAQDREQMLRFMAANDDCLLRTNPIAHLTCSIWTLDPTHTKTLMVYHNIYDSWSWVGGHADGEADLRAVALRELREETGVEGRLLTEDIFSLETLCVSGHWKKGAYVPCHLHFNLTFLAEADDTQPLAVKPDENKAVQWFALEDVPHVSKEPWMVEHIYQKLIQQSR